MIPPAHDRVAQFAFPGSLRDRLVAAVVSGQKTATTSLAIEWRLDADRLPCAGERELVIDSDEVPVALIELTEVTELPMGAIDLAVAREEGEGFTTVAEWRAAHEEFWLSFADELRTRLGDPGWDLSDDTLVVVQRFRVVELLDP